jgi:hypothetical protein
MIKNVMGIGKIIIPKIYGNGTKIPNKIMDVDKTINDTQNVLNLYLFISFHPN